MRGLALAVALAALLLAPLARAEEDEAARAKRWHGVANLIFNGTQPIDLPGWVTIDAPTRAMDAALVPVTLTIADGRQIKSLYLVVDENPSPVAAHILFGPASDPHTITMRIRVDQYTNLHAVVETPDGRLISSARFIKAAGGCSAPGSETPELALKSAGKMKLRINNPQGTTHAELLIRHPNFNGMQMDQATRLYTPARYINSINVAYNGQQVFHLDADISMASDPAIGFGFKSDGSGTLSVEAEDTSHATWHQDFPIQPHGT
jgi:sulfur-oxidizing protein SoxY